MIINSHFVSWYSGQNFKPFDETERKWLLCSTVTTYTYSYQSTGTLDSFRLFWINREEPRCLTLRIKLFILLQLAVTEWKPLLYCWVKVGLCQLQATQPKHLSTSYCAGVSCTYIDINIVQLLNWRGNHCRFRSSMIRGVRVIMKEEEEYFQFVVYCWCPNGTSAGQIRVYVLMSLGK